MKFVRNFLNYAIFSSAILLVLLLVFESYLSIPNLVQWIGHWHPLILHFPIVMILVLIIQFWRKDQYFEDYLGLTVFLTFLTSITGLLLSIESGEKGSLIINHQWLGISLAFILGIWYWFSDYFYTNKQLTLGLNTLLVILVISTGHFGGMITHGERFLSLKSEKLTGLVQLPEDPLIYKNFIQPILDRKCVSCHNQNKSKGKLVLTNYDDLLRGGESGALINSTGSEESLLLRRINLPLESEEHMPPKQEPQLTNEERILLFDWIQNGADSELTFSQLTNSSQAYSIIQNVLKDQKAQSWNDLPDISDEDIHRVSSNYISIFRLYNQSDALQAIMYPHKGFKSGDVSKLKPVAENIVELSLKGLSLTDEDLVIVGRMSNLEKLDIARTSIQEGALKHLESLHQLKELRIYDSDLDGNALSGLTTLSNLEKVYAYNSGIPAEEIVRLFDNHPNVSFIMEAEQANQFRSVLPSPMLSEELYFFEKPYKLQLEHPLKGIDIFYTMDGTIPNENSKRYIDGIEITKDSQITYFASKEGWQSSSLDSFKTFKSGRIPDNLALTTAPNEKYAGSGVHMLFDLKKGPLTHSDSSWMGYRENAMILECSWDQPHEIKEITLSTFVNSYSYIFPPEYIRISAGLDRSEFRVLFQLNPKKLKEDEGAKFNYYECTIPNQLLSHIKIEIQPLLQIPVWHQGKGERGWFFIDEVLIN